MNKTEQKRVNAWLSRLQEIQHEMETLVADLEEKLERRSERYRESEKGEEEQQEFSALQDALGGVETAVDYLVNLDLSEVQ